MADNRFEKMAEYITANQKKFYRLAYSYAGNEQDALDIVQNAICKALKNYNSIQNINYLSTWFYRVLVNESLAFIKAHKREILKETQMLPEQPYVESAYDPIDSELYDAVNKLAPEVQTVLKLRFYEEFSLKEIASITNSNLNTVKARLYRGLQTLRMEVKDESI